MESAVAGICPVHGPSRESDISHRERQAINPAACHEYPFGELWHTVFTAQQELMEEIDGHHTSVSWAMIQASNGAVGAPDLKCHKPDLGDLDSGQTHEID